MTASSITGCLFDVQSLCFHDGPGTRTVLFFKGCPLRCRWCSNPEGIHPEPQLRHRQASCEDCGSCLHACRHGAITRAEDSTSFDRSVCPCPSLDCLAACPSQSLSVCGRTWTPLEALQRVRKDTRYFRRDGGVTLSGGEPLLQPRMARAVLELCRDDGLHTTVETCGHAPWDSLALVSEATDSFLYDLKCIDPDRHRAWVGVGNETILANLERLASRGAGVVVRIPVVPGFNDSRANAEATTEVMRAFGLPRVQLLPYHGLGAGKYRQLGEPRYALEGLRPPDAATVQSLASVFSESGIDCIVG